MNRVVITGMGAVTPVGNDLSSFWDALLSGKNGIGPLTRFDTGQYKAKLAAEVKGFDPLLYMEKSETKRSDLFTQYALAAATQAAEDSGILGRVADERLAVYFGSGIGGIGTVEEELQKLREKGPRRVSPYCVPMMIVNMAAGTIAIHFNAKGPCVPSVTACATGSNAIGEAYRLIRHGYADAAIAGGAEASITPISVAAFISCMALSSSEDPQAASLPFDRRRGGFVMGEGAGALILEEYEHAKKRGAKIYAEVSGYGSTCDAYHITAPHPEAEGGARAICQAIEETCALKGDESAVLDRGIYINAHGTGTPLNDKAETLAIKKALGHRAQSALISSTKSMTGHMLGAAGAVEAIAAVKALTEGVIPPTINLLEPDPDCDLDYVPLTARMAQTELALSVSLGFGGHNACLAFIKPQEA